MGGTHHSASGALHSRTTRLALVLWREGLLRGVAARDFSPKRERSARRWSSYPEGVGQRSAPGRRPEGGRLQELTCSQHTSASRLLIPSIAWSGDTQEVRKFRVITP